MNDVLRQTLIPTRADGKGTVEYIPLRDLVKVTPAEDLKTITAGRNGEYIPFCFYETDDAELLMAKVRRIIEETGDWETAFSGSFFSNREMLDELVVILFISILLMYFILAAQFESLYSL